MKTQLDLFDKPQPVSNLTQTICCRECDAEVTATRIDASQSGWRDFVFERNSEWTWFDFSAVCPLCNDDSK